jgi:dephospho-CoA kinase
VVFEMASKGTWKDDLEDKFDRYEQLGVHEYFLFDPEAEYLVPVLQGYRLHGSAYRRIREADGELTCELGFRLRAEDTILRLIDGRTNQPILTRAEAADAARKLADAAEQEAVRAKQQADVARQHADRALRQMDAERQRADALATELAALRQRLSGGGAVMAWRHGQKPVIGLVGGIGAGKSTAGRIFAARGGFLIDADVLGHEALEQDVARLFILERWGSRANLLRPDGRIDRRALGRVVFENSADRRALEEAVFPYIRERAFSAIAAAQVDPAVRFVVLDAAVMLEAGWGRVCDKVIYIDAPRSVRLARVAIRSGWSDDDLTSREAAQWSADRKKAVADAVVVNDDGPEKIGQQLDELLETWGVPAG